MKAPFIYGLLLMVMASMTMSLNATELNGEIKPICLANAGTAECSNICLGDEIVYQNTDYNSAGDFVQVYVIFEVDQPNPTILDVSTNPTTLNYPGAGNYTLCAFNYDNILYPSLTITDGMQLNDVIDQFNIGDLSCYDFTECDFEVGEFGIFLLPTAGECSANITAYVTEGTGPYMFEWNNGSIGSSLDVTVEGTYTVTALDMTTNCTITESIDIVNLNCCAANAGEDATASDICQGTPINYSNTSFNEDYKQVFVLVDASTFNNEILAYSHDINDVSGFTATSGYYSVCAFNYNSALYGELDFSTFTNAIAISTHLEESVDDPCWSISEAFFNIHPNPVLTVMYDDPTCAGNDGGIWMNVESPTAAPYTYTWSNGMSGQDIEGLGEGVYTVTVTDGNGCSDELSVTLNAPECCDTNAGDDANSKDICHGSEIDYTNTTYNTNNNQLFILIDGTNNNILAYSDDINDVASFPYPSSGYYSVCSYNYAAGTYGTIDASSYTNALDINAYLDGINEDCWELIESFFYVHPNPVLTVMYDDPTCAGNDGGIWMNVESPTTAPYTYTWSNGMSGQDIEGLSSGEYTVTLTDGNGCTAEATITLVSPVCCDTHAGDETTHSENICEGSAIAYSNTTYNSANSQLYVLINGNDNTILAYSDDINDVSTFAYGSAGYYSICSYNYDGAIYGAIDASTYTNALDINAYLDGINEDCWELIESFFYVHPNPVLTVMYDNPTCAGNDGGIWMNVESPTAAPYTYAWSNGMSGQDIEGLSSGEYTVTLTDGNGCTAEATITLVSPVCCDAHAGDETTHSENICEGSAIAYSNTTYNSANSQLYVLINGNDNTILAYSDDINDVSTFAYGNAGYYSICSYNYDGAIYGAIDASAYSNALLINAYLDGINEDCWHLTESFFHVYANPVLTVMYDDPTCAGNDGGIWMNVESPTTEPYTYAWSNGMSGQDIEGLSSGEYTVTLTDGNGCTAEATITLVSPDCCSANAGTDAISENICDGAAINYTNTTYNNSYGQLYVLIDALSTPNTILAYSDDINDVNSFVYNGAGYYSICSYNYDSSIYGNVDPSAYSNTIDLNTYFDNLSDCWEVGEAFFYVHDTPTIIFTFDHPTCDGENGGIWAEVSGGTEPYSYSWSTGPQGPDLENLAAGEYTLIITDANGCTAEGTVTLNSPDCCTVNAGVDATSQDICDGEAIDYNNESFNGANTHFFLLVDATTEYYDIITYSSNYSDVSAFEYPGSGFYSICSYSIDGELYGEIDLSTFSNAFDLNAYLTTSVLNPCWMISEAYFYVHEKPTISLMIDQPTCEGGDNGGIWASVEGGSPPYIYEWSNGENGPDLLNLGGGTYSLTVTDANGCSESASIILLDASDCCNAYAGEGVGGESCIDAPFNYTNTDFNMGADYTQVFVLLSQYGDILAIGSTFADLPNASIGDYTVCALNYHTTTYGTINFEIGELMVNYVGGVLNMVDTPCYDLNEIDFTVIDCTPEEDEVILEGRVMLQGALMNTADNLMRDDLRSENLIPEEEPYTALDHFTHYGNGGSESCPPSVFDVVGEDATVDWVMVELRDETDPTLILTTCSGLVQRDGDIVAPDGVSPLVFPNLSAGNYYVVVRHRNHLGVMTDTPVYLSNTPTVVDFTSAGQETWGENARIDMGGGLMALWAGNATSDDSFTVIFQGLNNDPNTDFFEVMSATGNTNGFANYIYEGYNLGDVDMNCSSIFQGLNNDPNIVFFNVMTHPDNVLGLVNYIIKEQIPNN